MKTILLLISCLILNGCASWTKTPKDPCADRPIYKPYQIEVPVRPNLMSSSSNETTSAGELVRTVEKDYMLLQEYAQKLENLINALPKDLSVKQ